MRPISLPCTLCSMQQLGIDNFQHTPWNFFNKISSQLLCRMFIMAQFGASQLPHFNEAVKSTWCQPMEYFNLEMDRRQNRKNFRGLPSKLWTLITPKLFYIKGSFFFPIKIWEICGHLQLVSCLYLYWSLCDSNLKKSFQKSPLQRWQNMCIFEISEKLPHFDWL